MNGGLFSMHAIGHPAGGGREAKSTQTWCFCEATVDMACWKIPVAEVGVVTNAWENDG